MSDLQRSFAKAKLAALPPVVPEDCLAESQDEGVESVDNADPRVEHSDDSSSASSASSTGTIKPSISRNLFTRPTGSSGKKSLEPLPWTVYFERELNLVVEQGETTINYHAYINSPTGSAPLFITHHGAGSSGLSFAVLSTEIRKLLPGAGMLSIDARGHGSTSITVTSTKDLSDPPLDLSLHTLSTDLLAVIAKTQEAMDWPTLPPVILIGHSLGGAVVTDVAKGGRLGPAVLGYAVLDVVEGSAIDALQSMQTYLSTRPTGFSSLEAGIEWHIRSRTIRNTTSARTSVPALLSGPGTAKLEADMDVAAGGGEDEGGKRSKPWRWRTDLAATQPFWEDWFVGLSKKFLEAKGGKLLLLAGTDRLDKELMIGQMQGKYALQVFPEAGHFIHEDLPEKTAMTLVDFYRRNDRSAMVMPPKVADLLKAGRKV